MRLPARAHGPVSRGIIRADPRSHVPSRVPVDGGGVRAKHAAQLGWLSPTRAVAADVHCGIGSWGAPGGAVPENGRLRQGLAAPRERPPPEGASVAYALSRPRWVLPKRWAVESPVANRLATRVVSLRQLSRSRPYVCCSLSR
jgi:hypothetical protein